jgi:hypothetical protein
MDLVIEFMKQNLAGPQDKPKCLDYIESITLSPADLDYAKDMLDRWISVGMFRKPPTQVAFGARYLKATHEFLEEHGDEVPVGFRRELAIGALQCFLHDKQ